MTLRRRTDVGASIVGVALALAAGLVLVAAPAAAHTPHDDVFGVAVSPAYATDRTAIAVSRGIAYRTTDGTETWERLVVGLTNREPLASIAVTCCEDPAYLVASPDDGIFRSDDDGDTWAPADEGLRSNEITVLASSIDEPGVAYAAAGEVLHRTEDGGRTWEPVAYDGGMVTALAIAADEVLVGDEAGAVHRSADGIDGWEATEVVDGGAVRAIARIDDDEVLVGTDEGGLLRTDGELGGVEAVGGEALDGAAVSSIAVVPATSGGEAVVWVSRADEGTVRSDDGGETWSELAKGLTRSTQADDARFEDRPHFGEVVVAPAAEPDDEPQVLLAAFAGLFVLDPGADAWQEAELMRSRIAVGLAISPDYATDRTVAVTTYMNGAAISTDGGDTWRTINEGIDEELLYDSGPDRFARLFGVAFSPDFATDRTMVAARWTDMLASDDAGETWDPVQVIPGEDPPLQQFVLAVGRREGGSTVLTGSRSGAIHRSTDGGRTYEEAAEIDGSVRSIVAVPGDEGGGRFLAATQRGVFATEDDGSTWRPLSDEVRNTTNLAVSPGFVDDGVAFAATRKGLFTTTDGGSTWVVAEAPAALRQGFVEGVVVAPALDDDGMVFASVRGIGLFRSTDGGATFSPVATELADRQLELSNYPNATAVPIVISPDFGTDRTLFGYSNDSLLRSTDAGETWAALDVPVATHPYTPPAAPAAPADDGAATASGTSRRKVVAIAGSVVAVVGAAGGLAWWARRRRRPAAGEPG